MKQILFSLLFACTILFSAFGQQEQEQQTPSVPDVFEQFQKEMQGMMQQFEQMPDFSRIWSDTLFFKDLDMQKWQDDLSQVQPEQMNLDEMMQWMQQQMNRFGDEQMPLMEDWMRQFDSKGPYSTPAPRQTPGDTSEPETTPQPRQKRKKRKVYSM